MKKLLCFCAFALFCSTAPLAVNAQQIDMGKLTCKDLVEMDEAELAILYMWLDGYFSHMSQNTILDLDNVESDLKALIKACDGSPEKKILDALTR